MEKYSLASIDGNAFCIMGYVVAAMTREKFSSDEIQAYKKDAMSKDYTHLVAVSDLMVDKLNERSTKNESDN